MLEDVRAVVMIGGRGTRMGGIEKPLVKILGKPLVEYIISALNECRCVKGIEFVSSVHTRNVTLYLKERGFEVFTGKGLGFLSDLAEYLSERGTDNYLVVSCDIPALRGVHVEEALKLSMTYQDDYLMYVLRYEDVRGLSKRPTVIRRDGVDYQPAGLRMIRMNRQGVVNLEKPRLVLLPFKELGVNVNTWEDISVAESVLKAMIGPMNG